MSDLVTLTPLEVKEELTGAFPGWHIWNSSKGRWWATRLGKQADRHKATEWSMTVDADDAESLKVILEFQNGLE